MYDYTRLAQQIIGGVAEAPEGLSDLDERKPENGATYELPPLGWKFLQRSTVNLFYERFRFEYDDFRDITAGGQAGTEPLYGFDADVIRVYVSGWF